MTDKDALLLAIIAHPDEDIIRLMYADEIEGDEPQRAEFIRVQCDLARTEDERGSESFLDKTARQAELIFNDRPIGWTAMPPGCMGRVFRRGFVEAVTTSDVNWSKHADAILAENPVREVTLTTRPVITTRRLEPIDELLRRTYRVETTWSERRQLLCMSASRRSILRTRTSEAEIEAEAYHQLERRATDPHRFLSDVKEWERIKTWNFLRLHR